MSRLDLLIPTIPHRHAELCRLLAELDRQMLPDVRVSVFRDNLETSYGDKCGQLVRESEGDYVAFLDDDDWIAGDYLKSVTWALGDDPDYVGWAEIYTVNDGPPMLIVHSLHDRSAEFPDALTHSRVVHKNPIRREHALLGDWSGGWGADSRWADSVMATGRVRTEAWIDHPVYFYRWRTYDEFRSPRQPMEPPFPELPAYDWLRETA